MILPRVSEMLHRELRARSRRPSVLLFSVIVFIETVCDILCDGWRFGLGDWLAVCSYQFFALDLNRKVVGYEGLVVRHVTLHGKRKRPPGHFAERLIRQPPVGPVSLLNDNIDPKEKFLPP
jgi:hypothetical protein